MLSTLTGSGARNLSEYVYDCALQHNGVKTGSCDACHTAVSGLEHFLIFSANHKTRVLRLDSVRTYVCVLRLVGVVFSWLCSVLCSEEQKFLSEGGNNNF